MNNYGQLILFSARDRAFIHSAIKWVTRSPYTHVAIMFPAVLDVGSYFGAEETVDMRVFQKMVDEGQQYYRIYEPQGFTQEQLDNVLRKIYKVYAGSIYGFFKLLWFVYRFRIMEGIFKKDVRRQHNWFPAWQICSEIGWWWFEYLCDEQPERMAAVRAKLHEWNSNTFAPVDCETVIVQFPGIFKLTGQRGTLPIARRIHLGLTDDMIEHES
jgi:hypothetical protein